MKIAFSAPVSRVIYTVSDNSYNIITRKGKPKACYTVWIIFGQWLYYECSAWAAVGGRATPRDGDLEGDLEGDRDRNQVTRRTGPLDLDESGIRTSCRGSLDKHWRMSSL